jgi:hypothetical protein
LIIGVIFFRRNQDWLCWISQVLNLICTHSCRESLVKEQDSSGNTAVNAAPKVSSIQVNNKQFQIESCRCFLDNDSHQPGFRPFETSSQREPGGAILDRSYPSELFNVAAGHARRSAPRGRASDDAAASAVQLLDDYPVEAAPAIEIRQNDR